MDAEPCFPQALEATGTLTVQVFLDQTLVVNRQRAQEKEFVNII